MQVEGQVEAISAKDRNTRYGVKKAYSAKIGNEWVNCGFKSPGFERGEYVSLEVEKNQYGLQLVDGSVSKTSGGAAQSTPKQAPPRVDFPVPLTDRGQTIARQNALTNAVNYLNNKYDGATTVITVEDVINIASQFAHWTTGNMESEAADEMFSNMFPNITDES